jgi:hypothetical protein
MGSVSNAPISWSTYTPPSNDLVVASPITGGGEWGDWRNNVPQDNYAPIVNSPAPSYNANPFDPANDMWGTGSQQIAQVTPEGQRLADLAVVEYPEWSSVQTMEQYSPPERTTMFQDMGMDKWIQESPGGGFVFTPLIALGKDLGLPTQGESAIADESLWGTERASADVPIPSSLITSLEALGDKQPAEIVSTPLTVNASKIKNGDTLYFPGYGAEKWIVDEIVIKDGKTESFKITNDKGFSDTIRGGPIYDRFVEANYFNGNLKTGDTINSPDWLGGQPAWKIGSTQRDGNGVITEITVISVGDGHSEVLRSGYAFDKSKEMDKIMSVSSRPPVAIPDSPPVIPPVVPPVVPPAVATPPAVVPPAVTSPGSRRDEGLRQTEKGEWYAPVTLRQYYDQQWLLDHGFMMTVDGQAVPNPDMVNTDMGRSLYNAGLLPAWGGMGPVYVLPNPMNVQGIDKNAFSEFSNVLRSPSTQKNLLGDNYVEGDSSGNWDKIQNLRALKEYQDQGTSWENRKAWGAGDVNMTVAGANPSAVYLGGDPSRGWGPNSPANNLFTSIDPLTGKQQLSTYGDAFLKAGMSNTPNSIVYGKEGPHYHTETEMKQIETNKGEQTYLDTKATVLKEKAELKLPLTIYPSTLPNYGPRTSGDVGYPSRNLHGTSVSPYGSTSTGVPAFTTGSGGSFTAPKSCGGQSCGQTGCTSCSTRPSLSFSILPPQPISPVPSPVPSSPVEPPMGPFGTPYYANYRDNPNFHTLELNLGDSSINSDSNLYDDPSFHTLELNDPSMDSDTDIDNSPYFGFAGLSKKSHPWINFANSVRYGHTRKNNLKNKTSKEISC